MYLCHKHGGHGFVSDCTECKKERGVGVERDRRIMHNVRRLIRRTRMSNAHLYSEIFGTGMGTAIERCRDLELDPDAAGEKK